RIALLQEHVDTKRQITPGKRSQIFQKRVLWPGFGIEQVISRNIALSHISDNPEWVGDTCGQHRIGWHRRFRIDILPEIALRQISVERAIDAPSVDLYSHRHAVPPCRQIRHEVALSPFTHSVIRRVFVLNQITERGYFQRTAFTPGPSMSGLRFPSRNLRIRCAPFLYKKSARAG